MIDALQYEFMRHALMAGVMAGVICGIMGTMVVVHRIVFLSGGIAHAAYGGIGLSFYMGWPLLAGTMGFSVVAAMTMAMVTLKARHRADTIIGVIWAVGMALGIVLLDLTPGYHVDLMSYLFGSILAVPLSDLWVMLACQAAVVAIIGYYYQDLLAMAYDEEFAQVRGVPVRFLYTLMIIMLAVSIVMIIQVVGLILVIALLTIGPFIVEKYTRSLAAMMLWSSLLNVVFAVGGLWISYAYDLTSGAAIILVAASGFFLDQLYYRLQGARQAQPNGG
jgi:zinc transport system permease protein